MDKFFNNIKFWYNNSRPYSVPLTVFGWLAAFVYSLGSEGSALLGAAALIGILLVHLSTNLLDDYFDYKKLVKSGTLYSGSKDLKCRYLKNGSASIQDLRNVIAGMLCGAAIIGGILFFTSGWMVVIFALAGLVIALTYSFLSQRGLGDVSVIIAYGPLLFEGVYYVMTRNLSVEIFILSLGCAMFVDAVLYTHMLMDYDDDVVSGHKTLCTNLGSKNRALNFLILLYSAGFIFILSYSLIAENYYILFSFAVIPLVIRLYYLLCLYFKDNNGIPKTYFFDYPLDNWNTIKFDKCAYFYLRFYISRNISVYVFVIVCAALCL